MDVTQLFAGIAQQIEGSRRCNRAIEATGIATHRSRALFLPMQTSTISEA